MLSTIVFETAQQSVRRGSLSYLKPSPLAAASTMEQSTVSHVSLPRRAVKSHSSSWLVLCRPKACHRTLAPLSVYVCCPPSKHIDIPQDSSTDSDPSESTQRASGVGGPGRMAQQPTTGLGVQPTNGLPTQASRARESLLSQSSMKSSVSQEAFSMLLDLDALEPYPSRSRPACMV